MLFKTYIALANAGDSAAITAVTEKLRPRLTKMAAYYGRATGEDADDTGHFACRRGVDRGDSRVRERAAYEHRVHRAAQQRVTQVVDVVTARGDQFVVLDPDHAGSDNTHGGSFYPYSSIVELHQAAASS